MKRSAYVRAYVMESVRETWEKVRSAETVGWRAVYYSTLRAYFTLFDFTDIEKMVASGAVSERPNRR